jgi:G:T-mismatch repair DNA endonuclease (very short patch repair protein)
VFCDGDFWHGRDWLQRRRRLAKGSNAPYWLDKIATNRMRDRRVNRQIRRRGWTVVRIWETDILADSQRELSKVVAEVNRISMARPRRSVKR